VLDASTGQNSLAQARLFDEAVGATGIALVKLDGTARGGIIVAIAKELKIPVRFIGVGEGLEDLSVFNACEFAEALI
jgi:fused signal recognition particle receptor